MAISVADNKTNEGVVFTAISDDAKNGKLVALACETKPVSKVVDFTNLGEALLAVAVAINAATKEELLAASFADGRTAGEHIIELTGKVGEKINIAGYENVTSEKVVSYIHSNKKIGVLIAFDNTSGADVLEVGKDIAMQIASMQPIALDKDDVDSAIIERETEIAREQALMMNKPESLCKIYVLANLAKFYKQYTLLNQEYLRDSSINIKQLLERTQKGLTITTFKRFTFK